MKLETTAGSLKTALSIAGKAIERRERIPILGMVKIDGAAMTATDLDTEIALTIPAVSAEGATCLPHRPLSALVRTLPADEAVTIEAAGTGATLSFAGGRYLLPSLPVADFPEFSMTESTPVDADSAALKQAISFAAPFMSTEETRYYLNGVCIDAEDAVATDGHRLASWPLGFDGEPFGRCILPRNLVKLLVSLPPAEAIRIGSAPRIAFDFPGIAIRAKTIDGKFPDWPRVVPSFSGNATHVTLSTARLQQAVRRISAFGRWGKMLTLAWEGHRCALYSRDSSTDVVASEIVSTVHPTSGSGIITFNADYMAQHLAALKGEAVTIRFDEPRSPALWTSEGMTGRLVLMPTHGDSDAEARAVLGSLAAESEAA